MAPQSFEFNMKTMQNCLEYLSNSLDWLSKLDDHELFRVAPESPYGVLLEQLQFLILAVWRVQNRYPMVNRLPVEILSAIFESLMPPYPKITSDYWYSDDVGPDDDDYYTPRAYCTAIAAPSLVCRHWRNIVLGTPALWTDVLVLSKFLSKGGNNSRGDFISTQLVRSGNCLLNVEFCESLSPASLQLTFIQDLLKQAHRIRRLTIRPQTMDHDEIRLWTGNAKQLEFLDIVSGQPEASRPFDGVPPSSDVQNPRIQTLALSNYVHWQMDTFRTLRHLILHFEYDVSLVDVAKGLMTVFALNAHTLEDIVVSELESEDREGELMKVLNGVSPIDMPALKRLVVKGVPLFHYMVESKLVLHDCARDYDCLSDDSLPWDDDSNRFPVKKLFLSYDHAIGTNGAAAMRVGNSSSLSFFDDGRDVQELWLRGSRNNLKEMHAVEKLIIFRNEKRRLPLIAHSNLFPALSELQLHWQDRTSYPALLDLLARRKEDGRPIKMLRLVRDPNETRDREGFGMFEQRRWELERYVANVEYDDLSDGRQAPRMELPAVCNTKSPAHVVWNPWKMD
ncbi:hypothetical protein BDW22DRAFT_589839 [Trametopsis cervina]|nr:hypothetical protein BDW22DRAFT_589839 [Trametopsis cervina]